MAFRPTEIGSPASSVALKTVETIRHVFMEQFAHWNQPLAEFGDWLDGIQQNRFTFLNRSLTIEPMDWNRRYESHLWNYQLQYFLLAPLAARALIENGEQSVWHSCRSLVEDWIANAKPGSSDGWDAYPVSLRTVNWIYAYALVAEREDETFLARWRASIFDQLGFLRRHLEHHLLANHLLKNVKALVVGGLFFQNENWLWKGEQLLWREFDEQVLSDGGHYERSPMYHAQAMADFLETYALLARFGRIERDEKIEAKLRAMADFLAAMSYQDGSLALFNDSANAMETRPKPLLESARRILGSLANGCANTFPQTGYYVWASSGEREKIVVDAGAPSVRYNTAHAHCDLLSYELWLDGQPFIVDSGVHGYGGDRFREYCRSTRAHNTVMFDDIEQSEVWSTFRMARQAKLIEAGSSGGGNTWNFHGKFARYDGRIVHARQIHRNEQGNWMVTDSVLQGKVRLASSFIHLHPAVEAEQIGAAKILCRHGRRRVVIEAFSDQDVVIQTTIVVGCESSIQGWQFPNFGVSIPSATIQFDYQITRGNAFGYRICSDLTI
ncbi:MAG: alginate lyase family protein [Acidobacteria bacterium]|nr:alginate lyase family protein [Acidobacteriota bacterium]